MTQLHGTEAVLTEAQGRAFAYASAFGAERVNEYPAVDAFERRHGFAIDRARMEAAARVLACPLKVNPPNWQHGRVLYTVARAYLAQPFQGPVKMLDIGTAKGFSALCLQWALNDSPLDGRVVSVDVIAPFSAEKRNTVAEIDGFKTLAQILEPWPEADAIDFQQSTGIDHLRKHVGRVHVAFVDGKHTGAVVAEEARLLARRQEPGDVAVFDDAQLPDVAAEIESAQDNYDLAHLTVKPGRTYVIARRR